MEAAFIQILNISITASYLVLVIILLRMIFKKAPKSMLCTLWFLVAIRLVCPFSFESVLSLVPSVETIPQDILYAEQPTIHSGIPYLNSTVNPIISESLAPDVGDSVNPTQIIAYGASTVWIIGMIAMMLYTVLSCLRIQKRVKEGVRSGNDIWLSDHIETPFIWGIIRPRIFLPSAMSDEDMKYVVAHERAHLRRHDHLWKPFGFLLLTVHWFNPLMWIAYGLLCRDIEYACDEKVIREMGVEHKKFYSYALINCSIPRKIISACPLAFGEVGVKSRIKSVLHYKKPTLWIVITALVLGLAVTIAFLTNPLSTNVSSIVKEIGYRIVNQEQYSFTITIPTHVLTEKAYTSQGQKFDKNEVVVYENDTSSVYLEKVMLSNEGDEQLYLMFNYSYRDINSTQSILLPYERKENGFTSCVGLLSSHIMDATGIHEEVVSIRGNGPDEKFVFYASTDVVKNASAFIKIGAVCNRLTYQNVLKPKIDLDKNTEVSDNEGVIWLICNTAVEPLAAPQITLNQNEKRFHFTWSVLSSYRAMGKYQLTKDELILITEDDFHYIYRFTTEDGKHYIFDADNSSCIPSYQYAEGENAKCPVPDGAIFEVNTRAELMN